MSEDLAAWASDTVAVLHVFSGVHLGARIELSAGTWLLGSDDACDLILMGLAPRHAKLRVESAGEVTLFASPEEGSLFLDGAQVEAETTLPCGEPWYLGETCFAWNLPNAEQKTILPQSAAGRSQAIPEPEAESVQEESAETERDPAGYQASQPSAKNEVQTLESDFQPVRMEEVAPKVRLSFWERLRRPIPLLCLAVLFAALSFAVSSGPSRSQYPAIIGDILAREGLADLAVSPRWPGVEVRGAVPSPEELEHLDRVVREVSFPVYLEVAVDNDLVRAVNNVLGIHGFSPVVRMLRGQGETRVSIAAFMRDALVEADAFAKLENDVPSPPVKERHIVHEQDVLPRLLAALKNAGFEQIRPVCLPGRITLTGNFSADSAGRLERLKSELSAQFGVPLFGESVFQAGAAAAATATATSTSPSLVALQANKNAKATSLRLPTLVLPKSSQASPASESAKMSPEADPLGGIKITGVFTAPLLFITTQDGQRFFPGSVLPNGNVLERISTTDLTLRSADKVFTYSLRGQR